MTPEQKAAYVFAQSVCAIAEIEGMRIANREREAHGHAFAYDEKAFLDVPNKYGIHHNTLMGLFHEYGG